MKQFEEIFTEKVKKAFENYDAGHLADKGWRSFTASRRRKLHAGIFIIPLWARAASVALIIVTGALLTFRALNRQNKQDIALNQKEVSTGKLSQKADSAGAGEVFITAEVKSETAAGNEHFRKRAEQIPVFTVPQTVENPGQITAFRPEKISGQTLDSMINEPSAIAPDSLNKKTSDIDKKLPDYEQQNAIITEALNQYLATDSAETDASQIKSTLKKSSVIAGLSGIMVVIENAMASSPGAAAGFYYEYMLSKRFAIRPGVAIAMHSSTLQNSTGSPQFNYAAPLADGTTGYTESYKAQLNLVALEIPLNMVFRIIATEKSSLYLSAGASTLICLNQRFTGTFVNTYSKQVLNSSTGETTMDTRFSSVEVENKEKAFSHTDYFSLANLSAGYSLPFGKNTIMIEPYLQIPVSGVTSLDLKIYYSGISLKLKFGK